MTDPIRPTDAEACTLARGLMSEARFAALAVLTDSGAPLVTRAAFGLCPAGQPISLVSDLSVHTRALKANSACSLLVGEPGPKGDPLTHPRLSLMAQAQFINRDSAEHAAVAAQYLRDHPKAKLYIGFADFSFVRFAVQIGHLNGGFGKAYHLSAADLGLPG